MYRSIAAPITALTLLLATSPVAEAGDPAVSCESGKLKVAGKYASCRLGAEAKSAKTGDPVDYTKCDATYGAKWGIAESKGEGMCPGGDGDADAIQAYIDECDDAVAVALGGGALPLGVGACNANLTTCTTNLGTCNTNLTTTTGDLATCTSDLATCNSDLATCEADLDACELLVGTLQTGQTTCWNSAGSVVPCLGTGHDGELQRGVVRSFTDNGDGTITDNSTGLTWEKHSNDSTIHDKDNTYTWANAYVRVAQLNTDVFAGHNDWRLPNMFELASLLNMEEAVSAYAEFNTLCPPLCTVVTCSCTDATSYWSSTTSPTTTNWARSVNFNGGVIESDSKAGTIRVRAVRGGN